MSKEIIDRAIALKSKYPEIGYIIDRALDNFDIGFWTLEQLTNQINASEMEMGAAPITNNYVADVFAPLNINMDLLNLEPYSVSTAKSYFDKVYNERKRIENLASNFLHENKLYNTLHASDLKNIIYKFTQKCIDISEKFDVRKSKLEWFI